jgi:hypothetical protein
MTNAERLASKFWEQPHKTQFVNLEMWECLREVSPRPGDDWPDEHQITAIAAEGDTLVMSFLVSSSRGARPHERMTITIENPEQIDFDVGGFAIGVASRIRWDVFDYDDPSPDKMEYIEYEQVSPTEFVRKTNGHPRGKRRLSPPIFKISWEE